MQDSTKLPVSIPEITSWEDRKVDGKVGVALHSCFFCDSGLYHKMPNGCTLCARCGTFIYTGEDDPMNEAMIVCLDCEEILNA